MAESPSCDDCDEFIFLDKGFLEMTYKPPPSEFQCALRELSENFLAQEERYEKTKVQEKSLKENIKTGLKENEKLKVDIAKLKEEISVKERELEKLNNQECKDLYKYESMLYRNITKIRWNMDCPENEISGVVGDKKVTTFQLDGDKHSKTFITNHLWDLIGNAE